MIPWRKSSIPWILESLQCDNLPFQGTLERFRGIKISFPEALERIQCKNVSFPDATERFRGINISLLCINIRKIYANDLRVCVNNFFCYFRC